MVKIQNIFCQFFCCRKKWNKKSTCPVFSYSKIITKPLHYKKKLLRVFLLKEHYKREFYSKFLRSYIKQKDPKSAVTSNHIIEGHSDHFLEKKQENYFRKFSKSISKSKEKAKYEYQTASFKQTKLNTYLLASMHD